MKRSTEENKTTETKEEPKMMRTRTPEGRKIAPKPGEYPAGRFGEIGAPGWMLAPENCIAKRFGNFPIIGKCVDLAICGYSCKEQCEKYFMFCKNSRVKGVRNE